MRAVPSARAVHGAARRGGALRLARVAERAAVVVVSRGEERARAVLQRHVHLLQLVRPARADHRAHAREKRGLRPRHTQARKAERAALQRAGGRRVVGVRRRRVAQAGPGTGGAP